MSTLRSGIDRFDADVAEYEARGQPKPSDEILRAVLLQLVPENLEEHLELNIQRFEKEVWVGCMEKTLWDI